jgi:hypothetical protein
VELLRRELADSDSGQLYYLLLWVTKHHMQQDGLAVHCQTFLQTKHNELTHNTKPSCVTPCPKCQSVLYCSIDCRTRVYKIVAYATCWQLDYQNVIQNPKNSSRILCRHYVHTMSTLCETLQMAKHEHDDKR